MENKLDKAAILIAESITVMIEALGMKSFNDDRIQNGLSAGYPDSVFFDIANELRNKIKDFQNEKNG